MFCYLATFNGCSYCNNVHMVYQQRRLEARAKRAVDAVAEKHAADAQQVNALQAVVARLTSELTWERNRRIKLEGELAGWKAFALEQRGRPNSRPLAGGWRF